MHNLIAVPELKINNTNKYRLSIQVSLNGFSFSIIDTAKNKLLAVQESPATISSENFLGRRFNEWSSEHELLKNNYAETLLLFDTEKFTLVPSEIYIEEKKDDIFRLVFGRQAGNSLKDYFIENIPCHLLFAIPNELEETFDNTFSNYSLLHPVAVLNQKMQTIRAKEKKILILYFERNYFSLLFYVAKKLQLTNSFSFTHINDVIFYILSILEQQETTKFDVKLFLAGDINSDDERHNKLKKYFSNIDFFIPDINYDSNTLQQLLHRFVTLC